MPASAWVPDHNAHGLPSHVLQGRAATARPNIPSNCLVWGYGREHVLIYWLLA